MLTTLYIVFRHARVANSAVCGRILPNFELICILMVVLVTCKNKEDPIKNEGARVLSTFSPVYVYGDFSRRSRAANSSVLGPIWPYFELAEILWLSLLPARMTKIR